jgi:hypothetical protein
VRKETEHSADWGLKASVANRWSSVDVVVGCVYAAAGGDPAPVTQVAVSENASPTASTGRAHRGSFRRYDHLKDDLS